MKTSNNEAVLDTPSSVIIPDYLRNTYWWAYLHPRGVRLFERRWLINLILFGNYKRLCDEVIGLVGENAAGPTLQIACVYGDLTQRLADCHLQRGKLEVVDVAPIQLANLRRKLKSDKTVQLHCHDSTQLALADGRYNRTLLFFLLHEQPWQERIKTLQQAIRVTRAGGQLIIIDYHRPRKWSPLHYLLSPILATLEPFAKDLWQHDISEWLPAEIPALNIEKHTYFAGLYQRVLITLPE